jgi:hypothetical protein
MSFPRKVARYSEAQMNEKRMKTLQDGPFLDSLIKAHVKEEPSLVTGLWKTDDIEDAVENFNGFLCAVAGHGARLSRAFLLQRLKKLFKTDNVTLEDFAGKMTQALRYCHDKGKRMTSGKKTSQAALKVIAAYGKKPPSSSKAASSQSDLEPPCLEVESLASGDDASMVDSKTEGDAEESDLEGAEALAALKTAKGLYSKYGGSAAASSSEVVDLTDSPVKRSQVPLHPDEVCTNLINM